MILTGIAGRRAVRAVAPDVGDTRTPFLATQSLTTGRLGRIALSPAIRDTCVGLSEVRFHRETGGSA